MTIGGGKVSGGDSSAKQDLTNKADSNASNTSTTNQKAGQHQSSSNSCAYGCGGSGQAQSLKQGSSTNQYADSEANAKQDAVNANVPVTIGGGKVTGGDSSASQYLDNSATSTASNSSTTNQTANQSQSGGSGAGQAQGTNQSSDTNQTAIAGQSNFTPHQPITVSPHQPITITLHTVIVVAVPSHGEHHCDQGDKAAEPKAAKAKKAKKAKHAKKGKKAKKGRKGKKHRKGAVTRHVAALR